MKLEVPYYSQFLDIDDAYWMPRACGMACLKMTLDFLGKKTPTLLEMCKESEKEGGYGKSGWFHDYFLKVAQSHNLFAEREEKMDEVHGLRKIKKSLSDGYPVIASSIKRLYNQTKFHMVLLVGYEEDINGKLNGFYYHDPESLGMEAGQFLYVDIETFLKDWRKMAIFFKLLN